MVSWPRAPAAQPLPQLPVIQRRPWLDPQLNQLADYLDTPGLPKDRVWDTFLRWVDAFAADPERLIELAGLVGGQYAREPADPFEIASAIGAGADAALARAGRTDPWFRAALLGTVAEGLVRLAWEVRGSGRASTVADEQHEVFHTLLDQADEIGYDALQVCPDHPVPAVARLSSARGLGVPSSEWWQRFERAKAVRPTLYQANTSMLQALCRKWYGNHDLMLDFARRVAGAAPVGDPVVAVLPIAHFELRVDGDSERATQMRQQDGPAIDAAAERLVAGEPAALGHPHHVQAHAWFASYYLKADPRRAAFHMVRTQRRVTGPWLYYEDPVESYRTDVSALGVRF